MMPLQTISARVDLDEWTGPYVEPSQWGYSTPWTGSRGYSIEEEEYEWRRHTNHGSFVEFLPQEISKWLYKGVQLYLSDKPKMLSVIEVVSYFSEVIDENDLADLILTVTSSHGNPFTTEEDRRFWAELSRVYVTVDQMV